MEISGKIIQHLPTETGQGKNGQWKKQQFVIETGDTYPKKICIGVWGDKINMEQYPVNTIVDVSFDVESRDYNNKWYTDVKAWKVATKGQQQAAPQAAATGGANDGSGLPF